MPITLDQISDDDFIKYWDSNYREWIRDKVAYIYTNVVGDNCAYLYSGKAINLLNTPHNLAN